MVVVSGSLSGSWLKNVATYPSPVITSDIIAPLQPTMSAKAVLVPRQNSHPFQERTLSLEQPVKVGRSVARARATATNAIFDCKVLSRHHALLWFENGKFFLQDTKSSNGTFVNNNRLSGADSDPHEVLSGDIVQFGVEVVENNRKVTHGCIIATLKLFLPDGKEAKASSSLLGAGRADLDELYRLNQYIQEAMQREQWLENKLTSLQVVVEQARHATDESWQAYVGEERLLSRVAALEAQQGGKTWGDERLREELNKLQEERGEYQEAAKEALRKLHTERLEAVATAAAQQRARSTAEQEASLALEQLTQRQQELQQIAQKLTMEQQRADDERALYEQRERELQDRLEEEIKTKQEMQNKLDSLTEKPMRELLPLEELEKCSLIYAQDMKSKEAFLGENESSENSESDHNINGSFEQNHINLNVTEDNFCTLENSNQNDNNTSNEEQLTERCRDNNGELQTSEPNRDRTTQDTDTNTIKLQYLTVQYENELRKQIDQLEQLSNCNRNTINELEKALASEKHISQIFEREAEEMRQELVVLRQQWKESCNEGQQLRDKVASLQDELTKLKKAADRGGGGGAEQSACAKANDGEGESPTGTRDGDSPAKRERTSDEAQMQEQDACDASVAVVPERLSCSFTYEQFAALEEELVVLKERYAQLNDEKLCLNNNYDAMRVKYNAIVNQSNNTLFFYVAPLVLMVLYLLISSMFS